MTDVATVVHARLGPDGWYDRAAIPAVADLDLLLVDGPPATKPETAQSRYPALGHFRGMLRPGAVIILDDILRRGERAVLRRWEQETGIAFERRVEAGAVAVGRLPT